MGVADSPRNMLLLTCVTMTFGHSRLNHTSIIMEICHKKILPLMSRLSRSLKVNETDTDQSSIYDFLLVFHSNHSPLLYRF